jgi:hypothetical protein
MSRYLLLTLALLLLAAYAVCAAAPQLVWSEEAEKLTNPGNLSKGATVVDDPAASGGKAVKMPYAAGKSGWDFIFGAPRMEMRGQVLFTFYLRAEGLPPLTPGFAIYLIAHDKTTGQWAFSRQTHVYGINLSPQGYTALTLALDAPWTADTYGPELLFQWDTAPPEGVSPIMYLDKAEISVPVFDSPRITEVYPDKIHYKPGDKVTIRTTVVNPLPQPVEATVAGQELWGLTSSREVFSQKATLAAGEQKDVTATYQLGPEEYGREIRVALLVGGKEVSMGREYFGVSKLPLWVCGGSSGDRSFWAGNTGAGSFYVGPASGQDSYRGVQYWKKMRRVYFEFFSWSPGDISDQDPQEDPFPGGEGRLTYRSKQLIIQQNEMLKAAGLWPVSYVNGTVWADSGYKLFQQHPEWFQYDSNGEVGGYEMDGREKLRHIGDFDFDPNTYTHIFFQADLNYSLPEVQEYVARQYIKCGKDMGFAGVRMDVGYLGVFPGSRDYQGKEIVKTYPEADKLTASIIHNVKAMVHKEIPDFTFGYNYASPEEVKDMMETFKERCEGGAWMLDEIPCTYQSKTSPYHVWKVYVRRMTSWGDQVRKWGGVYNPYDFERGSMPYQIDLIYSAIFRIICGGRDYGGWYYNSRLPIGDYGAFTTRFSQILMSTNLDWIKDLKDEVEVKAPAEIWYKDMCYWNKSDDGKRQLVVHLVNPPKVAEVNENPKSEINPPVRDIQVTCAPQGGAKPTAAYLVMSEPLEPTGLNDVQVVKLDLKDAPGGKVAVTVPSVLFWKTVVFQW